LDRLIACLILLTGMLLIIQPDTSKAQASGYELIPAPDLWYNDVDGIRVGLRLKGQVPGSFDDGPHRLDAGVWLSTWFPDVPVSYYISYTNPVDRWSDFGSEASYQLISSIRTGYHIHGVALNKRWQQGFDERKYRETRFFNSYERRFEDEYAAFPSLWGSEDKVKSSIRFELRDENRAGWYKVEGDATAQYLNDPFGLMTASALQHIDFHKYWGLKLRLFAGVASSDTAPEYLFSRSGTQAIHTLRNGVTRAKGTIPQPWMESGKFQVAGGANLRGYTSQDVDTFIPEDLPGGISVVNPFLMRSVAALNAEFDYFNPIALGFNQLPYISEFLTFRSYLFFDAGRSLNLHEGEPETLFADAGTGFSLSLNIPDYLGKSRGFVLRYEIPFWLSDPVDEDSFKLRHLFSFGGVITF
jgi:hypothetical protein